MKYIVDIPVNKTNVLFLWISFLWLSLVPSVRHTFSELCLKPVKN